MRPHHHRHHITDPLAPLSERGIRRRSRQDVQGAYSPLIDALARHAQSGYANIQGISNQLAGQLGSYQGAERDIYSRARQSLGEYNTQSAQALGTGQADALRQRLIAAGQDPGAADQYAGTLGGAQGAGTARGGAELQALTGQQAAAEDYGAKLPGIARLGGQQQVGERQARYQQDVGDIEAHIPGEVAQAISHARDLELQKATANLGFRGDIYKVQAQNARQSAANKIRMASIRAENQRTGMNLKERARHNGVSEREQAQRDNEHVRHNRQAEGTARKNAGTARQNARTARWKAHHPGKSKSKTNSDDFWSGP